MNKFAPEIRNADVDSVAWLEGQVALLKERQFARLDMGRLIAELETLVLKERRALRSRLIVITAHLLKCEFQPAIKTKSWRQTLYIQRKEIEELLEDSPSLVQEVCPYALSHYAKALRQASYETSLPKSAFPPELPYTEAQLLDFDFIP